VNVQKIKEFIKKYWGYFIAFAFGVIAYLGIDTARGKRIDRNISQLKSELREYELRIEQLESLNRKLAEQAKQLGGNNQQLGETIQELGELSRTSRDNLKQAERVIDELQGSVTELGDDTGGLRNIENRLQQKSESVKQDIDRLGEFIKKYSQKTNGD